MKPNDRRFLSILLASSLTWVGCGKQEEGKPTTSKEPSPPSSAQSPAPSRSTPGEAQSVIRPKSPPASAMERPSSLEQYYREAMGTKEKRNVAYKLGEVGTKQAVESIGRLFQSETDPELKEDLLSALWLMDGSEKERIAIYAVAARAEQPHDVRLEAIDGLSDIEDPEAKRLLQSLVGDPNEDISEAATDALAALEE